MTADTPRLRLAILGVIVVSLFAALFARLWFLQVLAAPEYELRAESNRVRFIQEQGPRGRILDRQGRVIVGNRPSMIVTVERRLLDEADDRPAVVKRLAQVLAKPVKNVERRLADKRYSPYQPVPVAEDVVEDSVIYLKEHQREFPGVDVREVAVRDYPYGPLAAHILGYVGEINDEELKAREDQGYKLGNSIGKSGVERIFERDLRGKPSLEKLEVNSEGEVLRSLGREQAVPGRDVQLTIDLDIQALAERSLAEQLLALRGRTNRLGIFPAPAGSVVVLDPMKGDVVAMASFPTYDPRQFINGISIEAFAALNDPANHFPLNNRAIQGQYAPGSTFKLITATAGLRSGLIQGGTPFVDNGGLQVGNRFFKNAGGARHGTVNVSRALTVSSDAFFYNLGNQFWEQRSTYGDAIQVTARDYGFGADTGVQLPSEQDGVVLTPELKAKLFEERPGAVLDPGWFAGDNVNLAIGQGLMSVTPLQLTNAYATFANGGTVHAPNIASKVLSPKGKVVRTLSPRVLHTMDLPPQVRDPILQGLVGVTSADGGTATFVFGGFPLATYPVAGKTGTAQVSPDPVTKKHRQDTGLFAAFAPAYNPQWAIAAVMEESGFGANSAAPVVRRILDAVSGGILPPAQPVPPLAGLTPGAPVVAPPPLPPGVEAPSTAEIEPDRTVRGD